MSTPTLCISGSDSFGRCEHAHLAPAKVSLSMPIAVLRHLPRENSGHSAAGCSQLGWVYATSEFGEDSSLKDVIQAFMVSKK